MPVEEMIVQVITNFPNFAGLALLAFVLYRYNQAITKQLTEQFEFYQSLLLNCLEKDASEVKGALANFEEISETLDERRRKLRS